MTKKLLLTLLLITIAGLSFGPVAPLWQRYSGCAGADMQNTLSEKSRQILGVWATLKVINGVINVLQSAKIGASFIGEASINPFEFLAPLDNLLDKLSSLLLIALGAVTAEKMLLAVSAAAVFKIIIPVCAALCALTLWIQRDGAGTGRIMFLFAIITLALSIAVPLSFHAASIAEENLFTGRVDSVLAGIAEKEQAAEDMERDISAFSKIRNSINTFFSSARDLGNALAEDFINYIIIFFVTSILIPLATVCALFCVIRYCVRLVVGSLAVPVPPQRRR